MDKNMLFQFAREIDCSYDLGLWSEINSFYEEATNIDLFNISFLDSKDVYVLKIKLKVFNAVEVKILLHDLLLSIEYKNSFYIQEDIGDEIQYFLLSTNKNKKGFLLEITFS